MEIGEIVFLRHEHAVLVSPAPQALLVEFADAAVLFDDQPAQFEHLLEGRLAGIRGTARQQPVDGQLDRFRPERQEPHAARVVPVRDHEHARP